MNYIIKGGEFNNKGAEAMSLIAIYNILEYDEDATIYFFDYGYEMGIATDLPIVPFRVNPGQLSYLAGNNSKSYIYNRIKNLLKYFLKPKSYVRRRDYAIVNEILSSADYFIDISGFSLSSVWGNHEIDFYLTWLEAVKKNSPNCKMFLMPQSFGPFDNSFDEERAFKVLSKCEKIYAREKKGLELLKRMGLTNVQYCFDSVLVEKEYNPENLIYNFNKYSSLLPNITPDSVGIVPNFRLIDVGGNDTNTLLDMYTRIIEVVKQKHRVYLIPHAGEDMVLCKQIKMNFNDNDDVVLIDMILNSFNYENAVKKMSYIIASRYHSIIHAYRESIPAIILGWSEKYEELAKAFDETRYIIDANNIEGVINSIAIMEKEYKNERRKIGKKLAMIQSEYDCYSFLR